MLAVCAFMNEAAFIYKPLQICLWVITFSAASHKATCQVTLWTKLFTEKNLQLVTQREKF